MRLFRAFARSRAGLAAVEFALIAPMMVFLLFGSVEIVNALQTNRRVENVSASIADVVSRDTSVSDDEIDGLWSALGPLMFPDTEVGVSVRITSISIVSASDARVVWSDRRGDYFSQLPADQRVDGLPTDMMRPGSSVIRVETQYTYMPHLGFWMIDGDRRATRNENTLDIQHTTFRRSRLVDPIARTS